MNEFMNTDVGHAADTTISHSAAVLLLLLISLAVAFGLGPIPALTRGSRPKGISPLTPISAPATTIASPAGRKSSSRPAIPGRLKKPRPRKAPARVITSPAPSVAGPATGPFSAVAGYGCANAPAAQFSISGWQSTGLTGFLAVPSGGLSGDGCNGFFAAMPMSGQANLDNPATYALWTFHTGAVSQNTCNISVFIPNDSNIEHVAGDPAYYQVFGSASAAGTAIGDFSINQPAALGSWVNAGSYNVTGGALTIMLHSRGVNMAGTTMTYAHIAVSPIQVSCKA